MSPWSPYRCTNIFLGEEKLSLDEIHGTCVSLLQAAPDTIASGIYQCVAWLCSAAGQTVQKEAYSAILEAYDGDRDAAWRMAFREEKVPLLTSLYKETLRFWTLTPFAVPRRTTEEISYNGVVIPKGITVVMNAQQANHDMKHYGPTAEEFDPYRYIGNNSPLPHLTYGAGSRICPAVAISNRIMSALLVRLILAFDMKEVTLKKPNIDMLKFSDIHNQLVAQPQLYDAAFKARDESWLRTTIASGQ